MTPIAIIPKEQYVRWLEDVKARVLARAREKYLRGVPQIVIRPLRPRDLGVNADEWVFNVVAGENTIIDFTLDDKTVVVVHGIYNLSTAPTTNEVLFGTGAETLDDLYIEDMYMHDPPAVRIDEPITYTPGSRVVIRTVNKAANSTEKLGFMGWVIEPVGRRIGRA